jgi:cell fate regulator YaaT (PSP1 superfamily)
VKFGEEQMPSYFLLGSELELREGDYCVVMREEIESVGHLVCIEAHPCQGPGCTDASCRHYSAVLRKATDTEVERFQKRRGRERDAMVICKKKVEEHGLPMKVSTVDIDEAHNKIIFHFTADKRVDFRALVRDLAATLHARIELWQIGVRDEARIIDGFGVCGKRLCCAGYFKEFKPISIRMAKNQDIALAPSKLSGSCGRLMCCLAFEEQVYVDLAKTVPPIGAVVKSQQLEAIVVDRNILKQTVQVVDRDDKTHTLRVDQVISYSEPRDRKGRRIKRLQDLEQEAEEAEQPARVPGDDETGQ